MRKDELTQREERRQPGKRRILEAMQQIRHEAPGLLNESALAAIARLNVRGAGGRATQ